MIQRNDKKKRQKIIFMINRQATDIDFRICEETKKIKQWKRKKKQTKTIQLSGTNIIYCVHPL